MITSTDIFKQVRLLSTHTLNKRPRILLKDLGAAFSITRDELLLLLIELENRGLVIIHRTAVPAVSLTNYGEQEAHPPGGIES